MAFFPNSFAYFLWLSSPEQPSALGRALSHGGAAPHRGCAQDSTRQQATTRLVSLPWLHQFIYKSLCPMKFLVCFMSLKCVKKRHTDLSHRQLFSHVFPVDVFIFSVSEEKEPLCKILLPHEVQTLRKLKEFHFLNFRL